MRKPFPLLLILSVLASATLAQKADREADLRSLVEAERGFAAASVAKGTRAAFLENLAGDSIVFQPGPVNGQKWWSERPFRPGVLTWRPTFADISGAGDMGITTGPWEFREKSLEDQPVAYGHFVSVWKRQANGAWKVAVDLGISHPQPQTPATEVTHPANDQTNKKLKLKTETEAERSALIRMENDFSKHVAAKKTADAFLSYLADDVRLYRMEAFPAVGREAARSLLAAKPGVLTWQPTKADVSLSGDLGYTYGAYEFKDGDGKAAENGSYVRIWKRQDGGKWKVVLDILNPIPPAPAN